MDIESMSLSKNYTDSQVSIVNTTINSIASGIKSIQNTGSSLIFVLNDDTTLSVAVTGLSDNNYTTLDKNKLSALNSSVLNLFSYVGGQLLFNGQPIVGGSVDLSNYYNKTEVNDLLNEKANSTHTHEINSITSLQTELDNRYTKLESLSKVEIEALVNTISKGMNWKESVTNITDLPPTGNVESDTRIVTNTTTINVWNGSTWIAIGSSANIPIATPTIDGQMSKEDKAKLDSIILANLITSVGGNITIDGDIIPSTNGLQNIGSPTNRFGTIYVNEAKLSTNTLYIGDTPVLGTSSDTIMIKGDIDQSITMKTTGVGTTKVISTSGVELSTSGMNANINVQATGSGSNANLSSTNQVNLTAPNVNISGSTDITGNISVDNLTIRGNVVMQGQTFDSEATTIRVEDNIIELNKNQVGYGVSAGRSGLKINRGDADAYLMVFDETDDMFKVGTDSTLQTLATQNYVNTQNLQKANSVHTHNISDVNNLQTTLDSKLIASNIKAGNNITITTNGNDVTINSTATGGSGGGGSSINDSASTTSTTETYSVNKINSLITEVNNTNFTNANEAKTLTINAIGDSSLATTNSFGEISNSLLAKKQNIVNALAVKGVTATPSDDIGDYALDINNIIQNPRIKNTKLNKLAGDTYVVTLTNPTTIENICTNVLEYTPADIGVVKYDCEFINSDSSSFTTNANQHIIFDGVMKQDNNITTVNMTNEGAIGSYTSYSVLIDSSKFNKINNITEALVSTNEVVTVTGTYTPTLVQANNDINLLGVDRISNITWLATSSNTSKLLLIYSLDSGVTWKGYDSVNHLVLDISDINVLSEVKSKGISATNLNALTQTDLDNIRNGSPKIRFAYYFLKNNVNDVLENDKITLKTDMLGSDKFSTHYSVNFDLVQTLTYTFTQDGTYTILYLDNN